MAERIVEKNYRAMMNALNDFMGRTNSLASNMQTLALVAKSALEDEDTAVPAIYKSIKDCTLRYSELAEKARSLAEAINEDLEAARREHAVWAEED